MTLASPPRNRAQPGSINPPARDETTVSTLSARSRRSANKRARDDCRSAHCKSSIVSTTPDRPTAADRAAPTALPRPPSGLSQAPLTSQTPVGRRPRKRGASRPHHRQPGEGQGSRGIRGTEREASTCLSRPRRRGGRPADDPSLPSPIAQRGCLIRHCVRRNRLLWPPARPTMASARFWPQALALRRLGGRFRYDLDRRAGQGPWCS